MGRRRRGQFPDFPDRATLDRAARPNGIYVIRFRNTIGRPQPEVRARPVPGRQRRPQSAAPGSAEWKNAARPHGVGRLAASASSCRYNNTVELDRDGRRYSIPVLRIHATWATAGRDPGRSRDGRRDAGCGGRPEHPPFIVPIASRATRSTARRRPDGSIRAPRCSTRSSRHDIGNVFVMDGASSVERLPGPDVDHHGARRPSCDHLLEEMKRGNV